MSKQSNDPPAAESIGRPGPWQESRYTPPDAAPAPPSAPAAEPAKAGDSVIKPPGEEPKDTISTPVTRADYE